MIHARTGVWMSGCVERVALASTALLLLAGCTKDVKAVTSAGPPPAPVKVAQAETRTLPVEVRVIGNVEAFKTISVKSQVGGALMQVRFKEGRPRPQGSTAV